MFRLEPASPEVIEVPDTDICGVCGSWLRTEFKQEQVRKCSHYTEFQTSELAPSIPSLSPASLCVPPPETKNFNPDLSFYFFSRIQIADNFFKFKSQIFISLFLGMSYRRCHQSQQDGHHYNDLLLNDQRFIFFIAYCSVLL